MRLVFGSDEAVASWASDRLKIAPLGSLSRGFVRPFTTIGVKDNQGLLSGAYIFNNFTGPDVELTVVGRGAISREGFKVAAHYAFEQLGCVRVTATISADNHHAVSIAIRYGFKMEGVARHKFGKADGILLGLLKEENLYERKKKSST